MKNAVYSLLKEEGKKYEDFEGKNAQECGNYEMMGRREKNPKNTGKCGKCFLSTTTPRGVKTQGTQKK